MGKLVARRRSFSRRKIPAGTTSLLGEAMQLKATARKNANVLCICWGTSSGSSARTRSRSSWRSSAYQDGHLPLIVPVTLINHYVRKYDQPYLKDQIYLNPHPIELHLRNHV